MDRAKQVADEQARRTRRAAELRSLLKTVSLSEFSADYVLDICIVSDPESVGDDRLSERKIEAKIDAAINRLEAFFAARAARLRLPHP